MTPLAPSAMLAGRQSAARGFAHLVRVEPSHSSARCPSTLSVGELLTPGAGSGWAVSAREGASFLSRRRYVSTEISLDTRLNAVSLICGDFAALLYSWLIPHAGDDAVVPHEAERIKMQVFPGRHDLELSKVEEARDRLISAGLLEWTTTGMLRFPLVSFYKYQTYIGKENRSTEERRETPGNVSSLSVSSSVSFSVPSSTSTDLSSADAKDGTPSAPAARKRASKKQPNESAIAVPDCLNGQDWGTPLALAVLYNQESADECPCVVTLDPERQRKATRALALYPDIEWWIEAFRETRQSRLLRGLVKSPGHENFRGDFDWFLQGGKHDRILNAVKAFEGKYRDGR